VRKLIVVIASLLMVAGIVGTSFAGTGIQINWTGQGSDNLPCLLDSGTGGGHWVLTGKGITGATAYVDGEAIAMTQNGSGSWYADSTNDVTASTVAYAIYDRIDGSTGVTQFVLSHCNGLGDGYPGGYN
jgi:hypothetical protein